MLQSYNKEQAVRRINYLSEQGKPFIFIINYLQSCSYIEEVDKLDPSFVLYNFNGFTNQSNTSNLLTTLCRISIMVTVFLRI